MAWCVSAMSATVSAATRTMPVSLILVILVLTLSLPATAVAASPARLPYIPTTILLPDSSGYGTTPPLDRSAHDVAYIFQPTASSVDLLALNISSTIKSSSISLRTLTSGLPFVDASSKSAAFTPTILSDGSIAVHIGDCSTSGSSALWTLAPPNSSTAQTPIWSKQKTADGTSRLGPSFLGGALSFSSQLAPSPSPALVYVYGGMCPWSNTSGSTWTRAAIYSNEMVKLSPIGSAGAGGSGAAAAYNISPVLSKGPPVAEAGFTLTALTPSITNRSGVVTQQVNHVMLGGHTQTAFINMSTAAIWSLPEEAWSFISIRQPSSSSSSSSSSTSRTGGTELAVVKMGVEARALATKVDSRSGHSTVLSEDGNSLVVLGGWVGDVSQAADPQLAVLEMGAGSAFDGWRWTVPTSQPSGPGIYGHGAALLPGNVMMVYGGHGIPAKTSSSSRKKPKRQAGAGTTTSMFLNLTSMTWSDDYANPVYVASGGDGAASGSSSSSNARDIGLGVGLGVGLVLLFAAAAVCLYFWRRRRRRNRRYARESAVRALAQDGSMFLGHDEMAERAGGGDYDHLPYSWGSPQQARDWYTGGADPFARGSGAARSLGYESLRASRSSPSFGLLGGPPPTRKPVGSGGGGGGGGSSGGARGMYSSPNLPGVLGEKAHGRPGEIHPIYEADEDGENCGNGDNNQQQQQPLPSPGSISPDSRERDMDAASDPFMTPVSATSGSIGGGGGGRGRSTTPNPEISMSGAIRGGGGGSDGSQDREVRDWVSDIDTADAVVTSRIGPHSTTTTKGPAFVASAGAGVGAAAVGAAVVSSGRLSPTRRASVRSKGLAAAAAGAPLSGAASFMDEEARTASNLSDSNRSAFSYSVSRSGSGRSRPGTSAGLVAVAVAAAAARDREDERRLDSSSGSSSNSGNSFNTARSSFAALQAEGPGLLLSGGGPVGGQHQQQQQQQHRNDGSRPHRSSLIGGTSPAPSPESCEDDGAPGSPSKSKARRSWFGSLRRVFSSSGAGGGGYYSPTESSRNESPASRRSFDGGVGSDGGDYEPPRLVGLGGMLMRRKQGREAWEEFLPGSGGSGGGGGVVASEGSAATGAAGVGRHVRHHDDGSLGGGVMDDDWDVERAVEQRLVQVMFTVPKERLRVVNAEIEREEEIEIVDPEKEDAADEEEEERDLADVSLRVKPLNTPRNKEKGKGIAAVGVATGNGAGETTTEGSRHARHQHHARHLDDEDADWDPFLDYPPPEVVLQAGDSRGTGKVTADMVRVPAPPGTRLDAEGNVVVVDDDDDDDDEDDGPGPGRAANTNTTTTEKGAGPSSSASARPHGEGGEGEEDDGGRGGRASRLSDVSHEIMLAEAVRLRRPLATRVLEMVEQIEQREESRSRHSSPAGSPSREG